MAQKLECDRCGAQAAGTLVMQKVGDQFTGWSPSIKDWDFVRPPRLDGKSSLLCPACIALLITWLEPLVKHEDTPEDKSRNKRPV